MPRAGCVAKMSRSAPTSPKNLRNLNKSSTLPSDVVVVGGSSSLTAVSGASPRKSRNTTLTNFLKRLSPKLRQSSGSSTSKSREKTWFVVEINQSSIDGDDESKKTSTSGLYPSRRPPLPVDSKDQSASSTLFKEEKLESEFKRYVPQQQQEEQSNEELLGTQQQRQPLIRINDTDCSPTQQAGPRVRRTQQPPKTLNILNKIVVHQPPVETHQQKRTITSKMASIESIGSCSLDIDATSSESSVTADGRTSSISQRTLHSVSVEFSSLSSSTQQQSKPGRTIRSPTIGGNDGEVRYVSELYIPNGGVDDDIVESHRPSSRSGARNIVACDLQQPQRKPSYIGISCSVSGYTSYSCYGSKTSRDNSPARLAFTGSSNNSSAVAAANGSTVESGDEIVVDEDVVEEQHTNSVLLSVNGGGLDVVDCSSSSNSSTRNGVGGRRSVYRDRFSSYSDDGLLEMVSVKRFGPTNEVLIDGNNNGDVEAEENDDDHFMLDGRKSLIQQRIERLYGPGALAQGFRLHRTTAQQNGTITQTSSKSIAEIRSSTSATHLSSNSTNGRSRNTPAVFRHLRQNFADQLTTTNVTSPPKYIPTPHKIPTSIYVKPTLQQVQGTPSDAEKNTPIANGNHVAAVANAATVPLAIGDHEDIQSNETMSNVKDAHWFILTMNDERDKIKARITRAEGYLVSGSLPEDACGRLRAAIGKANLLLAQKFQQFRGLCEKNLIQGVDEPFPTTISDLAGFWDMVLIQVDDIHSMFTAIEKMRDRGWIVDEKNGASQPSNGTTSHSNPSVIKPKRTVSKVPATTSSCSGSASSSAAGKPPNQRSAKADEAAKARTEARKRLLEAKRKGRQQASANENNATAAATIEIYVPENKE